MGWICQIQKINSHISPGWYHTIVLDKMTTMCYKCVILVCWCMLFRWFGRTYADVVWTGFLYVAIVQMVWENVCWWCLDGFPVCCLDGLGECMLMVTGRISCMLFRWFGRTDADVSGRISCMLFRWFGRTYADGVWRVSCMLFRWFGRTYADGVWRVSCMLFRWFGRTYADGDWTGFLFVDEHFFSWQHSKILQRVLSEFNIREHN